MKAQAGVGKENYNWWMKNVQLIPYTWDQLYDIIMREDDRLLTTIALERNRNKDLPELKPVPTLKEHNRRRDEALAYSLKFMQEQELFDMPDGVDVNEYLGRRPNKKMRWGYFFTNKFVGSGETEEWPGVRDFFHKTADREPLPEQTHEFIGHYLDGLRHSQDKSPIRGSDRFYAIDMIRSEGLAFWLSSIIRLLSVPAGQSQILKCTAMTFPSRMLLTIVQNVPPINGSFPMALIPGMKCRPTSATWAGIWEWSLEKSPSTR